MAKSSPKQMQRLDKCVSHLTGMSRQQASKVIRAGDVTVDGEVITDAAQKISIESQIIIADFNDDDTEVATAQDAFKRRVFMLNKPYDFICADRDKHKRLVVGLFNTELKSNELHTAGRLDLDTTGLLVVTDDGELIHQITSPKKEISKLYYATLDKAVPEHAVRQFAQGIKHPEESKRYQPATLILLPDDAQGRHRACVQLSEGRYHEVKRLFEVVGCEVTNLARLAIGSLTLGKLGIGDYTALDDQHLELLFTEYAYGVEDCLELIERQEQALRQGPLTFIPESYRQAALSNLKKEPSSMDDGLSNEGADSDADGSPQVTAMAAGLAAATAVGLGALGTGLAAANQESTEDDVSADPYFDEDLDAELEELYGGTGYVEDNWEDAEDSEDADADADVDADADADTDSAEATSDDSDDGDADADGSADADGDADADGGADGDGDAD